MGLVDAVFGPRLTDRRIQDYLDRLDRLGRHTSSIQKSHRFRSSSRENDMRQRDVDMTRHRESPRYERYARDGDLSPHRKETYSDNCSWCGRAIRVELVLVHRVHQDLMRSVSNRLSSSSTKTACHCPTWYSQNRISKQSQPL